MARSAPRVHISDFSVVAHLVQKAAKSAPPGPIAPDARTPSPVTTGSACVMAPRSGMRRGFTVLRNVRRTNSFTTGFVVHAMMLAERAKLHLIVLPAWTVHRRMGATVLAIASWKLFLAMRICVQSAFWPVLIPSILFPSIVITYISHANTAMPLARPAMGLYPLIVHLVAMVRCPLMELATTNAISSIPAMAARTLAPLVCSLWKNFTFASIAMCRAGFVTALRPRTAWLVVWDMI